MEAKAEERWGRLAWRGNAWCPWKGEGQGEGGVWGSLLVKSKGFGVR